MKAVQRAMLAASLLASPAFAQSSSGSGSDLPDRARIDVGYFRINAETVLRLKGPEGPSGGISFEKDLGVNRDANTFWLNGRWRMARRHQLELSYTRLSRDQPDFQLQRDFVWGGQTYTAGLTASSTAGSDILGGYYRFAVFRNDRFEIGPTIGIGYLWLDAGIRATGTIAGPGGPQSRTLDESASTGSPTGALGAYADGWLTKRLVIRGDFLYIKVSPGHTEASVTDWRLGANYYFFRRGGLGVEYKYYDFSYDRGALVSKLGGEITYKGFQAFLSFLF